MNTTIALTAIILTALVLASLISAVREIATAKYKAAAICRGCGEDKSANRFICAACAADNSKESKA